MFAECDEYSLRVIISLCDNMLDRSGVCEKTKIAETQIDAILDLLLQSQLITVTNGTYQLLEDPRALSLFDVLNKIRSWQRWSSCPLEVEDHSEELCPLHRRLENISALVERQLRATTIASLVSDQDDLRPLCNKLQQTG